MYFLGDTRTFRKRSPLIVARTRAFSKYTETNAFPSIVHTFDPEFVLSVPNRATKIRMVQYLRYLWKKTPAFPTFPNVCFLVLVLVSQPTFAAGCLLHLKTSFASKPRTSCERGMSNRQWTREKAGESAESKGNDLEKHIDRCTTQQQQGPLCTYPVGEDTRRRYRVRWPRTQRSAWD